MKTYDAIVSGDQIEWIGEMPAEFEAGGQVPVKIAVPPATDRPRFNYASSPAEAEPWTEEKQQRLREIMAQLQALNPFRDIEDAVEWQREIRKDRPLSGREP